MYTPDALRAIIRTSYHLIDLWSPEAEELSLGTAAKESHLGRWLKQIKGPALGPWQMEPNTLHCIWVKFLRYDKELKKKVIDATGVQGADLHHLQYNPVYGAIMTRLHYRRIPTALPADYDIIAQGDYGDTHYNRNPEKGFPSEYVELY